MKNFKTNIGLEIHVQLKTKSKMFCGCDNQSYAKASDGKFVEAAPNTLVCPICMGFPGVLPVANKQAIEWTIKTALALNCQINPLTKFDRKHYFYPDLPKNFQISQYDLPFSKNGWLDLGGKKIRIKRVHLEEDAGKLVHRKDYSLVDFNRSGTPLMEVVTEPDITSGEEAKQFLRELRTILRYLQVSDADMEKGHMRCDANISIAAMSNVTFPEQSSGSAAKAESQMSKLGTPVEIKNMNSFKMVEKALNYEAKRQGEIIASQVKIVRETRGWIDDKGMTVSQRSKETAPDYRYFPEPDLPPFKFSDNEIRKIKGMLPELPEERRKRFVKEYGLGEKEIGVLLEDRALGDYFEETTKSANPQKAANWILVELLGRMSREGRVLADNLVKPSDLADLINKIEKEEISGKMAKEIFDKMFETGRSSDDIIKEKGLKIVSGETELSRTIRQAIKENPKTVLDYKKGKTTALQYLVGQVMRKTKGQANPQKVNQILIKELR